MKLQLGIPKGSPAGRHRAAVRARRLQHLRQLALVFPGHRRSGDRVHADPRAGDGALRRGRRPRCRPHRAGLDRRARRIAGDAPHRVVAVAELVYAKQSFGKVRWVLAAPEDSRFKTPRISRARPSPPSWCASPRRTSSAQASTSTSSSPGARPRSSRRCWPTRIVEATETGSTLRANRLRIIDTVMESNTQLIANPAALGGRVEAHQDREHRAAAAARRSRRRGASA